MRPEFADKSIENGLKKGWITQNDIALIREFVTEKKVSGGIGLSRVNKITYTLVHWRRFLPEYDRMTIADVYSSIEELKTETPPRALRSHRTPSTTSSGS